MHLCAKIWILFEFTHSFENINSFVYYLLFILLL